MSATKKRKAVVKLRPRKLQHQLYVALHVIHETFGFSVALALALALLSIGAGHLITIALLHHCQTNERTSN